jgi:hypothetical protein
VGRMETAPVVRTNVRISSASLFSRRQPRTVLVYEDLAAAAHAFDLISRVASELQPEFEIFNQRSRIWNFGELGYPETRDVAKAAAIGADLIIVSARSDAQLPAVITQWIESWLPEKVGQPTALIALLNRESASPERHRAPQPVRDYLRRVARFAHMVFLCDNGRCYARWSRKLATVIKGLDGRRHEIFTRAAVPLVPETTGHLVSAAA